jgi:hypothetical protein
MSARYLAIQSFPEAVRTWSRKPISSAPADQPPCGYIPGVDDENRMLASTFAALCACENTTARLALLGSAIVVHERRLQLAWDAAKGHGSTRTMLTSDRSAMVRLRPYEAMLDALKLWADELHESAMSEIGVVLIDDAARRTA